MANPFDQFDQRTGKNPFDAFSEAQPNPAEQGGTLSLGPIDTGIPTGPGWDQFFAGMGKRFRDIGTLGLGGSDAKASDANLMQKGWAQAGSAGGDLATILAAGPLLRAAGAGAAAVAPRVASALDAAGTALVAPQTLTSGAAAAAGYTGLTTPGDLLERGKQALEAGGLSAAGQIAGNVIGRGYQAAKAAAEPLYAEGQNAIMGRLLNKVSGGGQYATDAANAMAAAKELVPGSVPTAAQAAGNPGIAALERTTTESNPTVAAKFSKIWDAQNEARVAALGDLADPVKRDFFNSARNDAADQLYKTAFAEVPTESPWIKGQFTQLSQRPAFKQALVDAQEQALNEGIKLDVTNTTQVAHYAKMALDDAIDRAIRAGSSAKGLISTRDKLVSVMESPDFAPSYRNARSTYAAMSKPVNEIDAAQAIQNAVTDKGTGRITPSKFFNALTDATAQKATGFSGATLANTFEPQNLATLQAIKQDLINAQYAQKAGKGAGSDTLQKLAYSNMVDQAGIPTWLRNFAPAQFGGNLLGRATDTVYGRANAEMSNKLAEILADPHAVAAIMRMPQAAPSLIGPRAGNALRLLMQNNPALHTAQ